MVCANFMQLMRPDPRMVDPRFLHLYLNHFHARGGTAANWNLFKPGFGHLEQGAGCGWFESKFDQGRGFA